jgi:hypothetical protein
VCAAVCDIDVTTSCIEDINVSELFISIFVKTPEPYGEVSRFVLPFNCKFTVFG